MKKQKRSLRIRAITLGAILLMVQISVINTQSGVASQGTSVKTHPIIESDTYDRVLDILFPHQDPVSGPTLWKMVLRFKPSSKPEVQIVIRQSGNKKPGFEVIEYKSPEGSIYNQLNRAVARGEKADAVQLAKSIKIAQRKIPITRAQARQWYETFFTSYISTTRKLKAELKNLETTGSESIAIHGTFYEIWHQQGMQQTTLTLYDFDLADQRPSGEYKLVQWMNSVRLAVEKLAK
jgi:hypothetical protein